MPESALFKNALGVGMAVTQLTRQRAESIVRDLVRSGELSREQAAAQVEELLARSRKNTDQLLALVRKEIDARLAHLATRDDLARLARSLGVKAPLGGRAARKAPAKKATAAKKAPAAKEAPARKAPVKKATSAKKAPAAKKAPVKKAAEQA